VIAATVGLPILAIASKALDRADARTAISGYVVVVNSAMSAPAANTFSPPQTTTARISGSPAAACAAARSSSWTWVFSGFIGGRSSRIVPMPSAAVRFTNSPTCVPPRH
jgi:hypothetical protein